MLLSYNQIITVMTFLDSVKGISLAVAVQYVVLANMTCGSCLVYRKIT